MRFRRIIALLVISLLISSNTYAEINNLSTTISLTDWLNTEEGREYIGAGITTYYVGDGLDNELNSEIGSSINTNTNISVNNFGNTTSLLNVNVEPELTVSTRFYINNSEITGILYNTHFYPGNELMVRYNITNSASSGRSVVLIVAIYDRNHKLCLLNCTEGYVPSNETKQLENTMTISNSITDCYAKVMLWDGMDKMQPLYETKQIGQVLETQIVATANISCELDKICNLVITAENIPANDEGIYTVSYDPSKLEIVDACSLTYKNDITSGMVYGTNINLITIDTSNGKIKFANENSSSAMASQVVNSIRFKCLASETNTLITIE